MRGIRRLGTQQLVRGECSDGPDRPDVTRRHALVWIDRPGQGVGGWDWELELERCPALATATAEAEALPCQLDA